MPKIFGSMPIQGSTLTSCARVAVIGAGPAGLMAAEVLTGAGVRVEVFDSMASVARKFLLAGVGGMNITHAEDYDTFVTRYGDAAHSLRPSLDQFPPQRLRQWIEELGIDTFVGTSGRVFPTDMKAAPLLRAWLHRLRRQGVVFHARTRWIGWVENNPALGWRFQSDDGERMEQFDSVVLALGGGSWPRLGSDGSWAELLATAAVAVTPLRPSNCGFEIRWSDYVRERLAGTPLKNVGLRLQYGTGDHEKYHKGELVITNYGLEGSLVYALSGPIRDSLDLEDTKLTLDWLPHRSNDWITAKLQKVRPGTSFTDQLRKGLGLTASASALLQECCPELDRRNAQAVSRALKAMPLNVRATRPLAEAISSAGGVSFAAVNAQLMLTALPGVFVAGEMLDWEAPTGGYLLTACFATGRQAGIGALTWLASNFENGVRHGGKPDIFCPAAV